MLHAHSVLLTLFSHSFTDALSLKASLSSRALHWSFSVKRHVTNTPRCQVSHSHGHTHLPGCHQHPHSALFFHPSHFLSLSVSLTPVLSFCVFDVNDSWTFYTAVDFHHNIFLLSLSCLTSSTAPCQLMTARRPCRLTATSARSSSTNATSEWPAVCPPCCRETPTRHTSLLSVQVRESQILYEGCSGFSFSPSATAADL